jgi:hypothetical protein
MSESCSRMVPPPERPLSTVEATDAGVAPRVQSRPQQVHNTGITIRTWAGRDAATAGVVGTTYCRSTAIGS